MPQLGSVPVNEFWLSPTPVHSADTSELCLRWNEDVLFGSLPTGADPNIERATRAAYLSFIEAVRLRGFPYLLRVWNHVPSINDESTGLERYKRFSVGRYEALAELGFTFTDDLPAASAVGAESGDSSMYFLAVRTPVTQLENPRQISAFHYPHEYGPKSPSFSRGALKEWPEGWQVFLSGTASIVGHQSVHAGDVEAQLRETLFNMEKVLASASEIHARPDTGLQSLSAMKVYVRNPGDITVIRKGLEARLAPEVSLLYVQSDICRSELLLEIEGVAEILR